MKDFIMANKKVTLVAKISAKAGQEDALKAHLLNLVPPSRAESGCINYDLHQSIDTPTEFMFYENWTNQEALDFHNGTDHLTTLPEKIGDLLAKDVELFFYNMLSEPA